MPDNMGGVWNALEPYGYPEMKTTLRNAVTLSGKSFGRPTVFAGR